MANTNIFLFLPPLPADKLNSYREHHPYGPNGSGGFETDLSIEILADKTPIPFSAAFSVCGGIIRCIPTSTEATIVLQPAPQVKKDILSTLGMTGSFILVYRNLTKVSVEAAATKIITDLKDKGFPITDPPAAMGTRFANSEFWLHVPAGVVIGEASTVNSVSGWARMGFEIVFIPGGISPRGENSAQLPSGWSRLKELIDPDATTRRLDPMAFYATIAQGNGAAKLDPSHVNHILLTLPTRRTLIEVRDEYDLPYTGPVSITKGGGAPVNDPPPPGSRGTFVRDTVPPGGQPGSFAYSVSIPGQIFTDLPSGDGAVPAPSRTLVTPSHWSTQTIFMNPDPAIPDEQKSWFVANTDSLPRFTDKNKVTVFRDGVETFRAYEQAINTIIEPDHFLELTGWILMDDFQLVKGQASSTFQNLSRMVTLGRGAQVRAMLWDDSTAQGNVNTGAVLRINALPNGLGHAILDDEAPGAFGSHHQKMLVVNGMHGAVGFCGGIDLNSDRRDSQKHGAKGGFHDVHAKFEGKVVNDLHRNFFRRWNNHPHKPTTLQEGTLPVADNPGTLFVEIARTFSPQYAQDGHYPFVPNGSLTPYNLLQRAIQRAQKYIYIEDQYFTPYPGSRPGSLDDDTFGIVTALRDALINRIDHLIIVIPNHSDLPQYRYRRQQAILSLIGVAPEKVQVFFLGRDPDQGDHPAPEETATEGGGPHASGGPEYPKELYCHSKVWMVDDVVAKIGSANLNRRSYSSDTELDAVMCDEALDNGARRFVKQFRMDLWGEHLNLLGARRAMLEDVEHAMTFFRTRPKGARLRPYDPNAEIETEHDPLTWNDILDHDGRITG